MNKSRFIGEIFTFWAVIYIAHVAVQRNNIHADNQIAHLATSRDQCAAVHGNDTHEPIKRAAINHQINNIIRAAYRYKTVADSLSSIYIVATLAGLGYGIGAFSATFGFRWRAFLLVAALVGNYQAWYINDIESVRYMVTVTTNYSKPIERDYTTCAKHKIKIIDGVRRVVQKDCRDHYECHIDYKTVVVLELTNSTHIITGRRGCLQDLMYHGAQLHWGRYTSGRYKCALDENCVLGRRLGDIMSQ
jgi:hypothetical protein